MLATTQISLVLAFAGNGMEPYRRAPIIVICQPPTLVVGGHQMSETDKSHFLLLVQKMRERAEEARWIQGPGSSSDMFEIAERYEKLASRIENEGS
jgi:hypothetical protein